METVQRLIAHLEEELKVYRALLDVVRKEKEILISANIEDLNENNKSKEAMLAKLKQLDRLREKHAREAASAVGADTQSPRLLEIAAKLDQPQADRLRSLHQAHDLLLGRLRELNKKNESLAQSALQNIQGAMQAIRTTLSDSPTYKKQGDIKKGELQSGQLVSREA